MKQTLTICLPLLLAAFYLGCKKEASDPLPATALGKAFVPPDETTGKLLIGSFLAALPQEGVASARASFSDTPVAEGRWLIEATGNYLWNHNMKNRVMHSVIESPLSINHAAPTAGGVAQLSGTDMTAKFDAWKLQLLSRLSANMVVGAIDIETESSSANKTNFKVKAAIMQTPSVPFHCFGLNNTPGNTNFSYVTQYTEVCLSGHLVNLYGELNEDCFYPDVYIVDCTGDTPNPGLPVDITIAEDGIACTTSTPLRCLHGGEAETFYINSAEQFVENQVDIAAQIFDDIEAEVFPPGPPGSALGPVPHQLTMNIEFKHYT